MSTVAAAPVVKPKAYSYLRFSTPDQIKGDSFRRQFTMAQAYAAQHALDLDTELTFHDLGVSAFKGANAESGRLADFLEAVRCGMVPRGSYLLVEALDRLSRLVPRKALRVLENIIESGVVVVTLNDQRKYTAEALDDEVMTLFSAVIIFSRANEESATKARRLRAAWSAKRETAGTRPLTSVVPAWLTLERASGAPVGEGRLVPIPERVQVVRRIFGEYLAGRGHHAIAGGLNADAVPCFGRATHWHRTYVSKIIKNPATHGTYIPHEYRYEGVKQRRSPLEPIPGYYPPAITIETFEEAQRLGGTVGPVKNRSSSASAVVNLFSGLATCPLCASTMTRVNKGNNRKGGKPKLVCVKAKQGRGCTYHGVDAGSAEAGLLGNLGQFIGEAPSGVAGMDEELERLDTLASVLHDQIMNIVRAMAKGADSAALAGELRELEHELAATQQAQEAARDKLATASSPVLAQRLRDLEGILQADPLDRPKASALLRGVLRSVVIDWPNGRLAFEWKHGGSSEVVYGWPTAA